jgi:zinc protease
MFVGFRTATLGVLFALLTLGRAAAGVETRVADNVFVVPDPKAKVITLWMIVKAGCRDEEAGQCRGLAHYLEHLMFLGRGAEHAGAESLFFAAGQTNAFTSMRATAYYQTVPAREATMVPDLERLFSLFAGRLRELNPPEDAARRERNVVLQEFNYRRADGFRARFNNELNAMLEPEHPIHQPVIGARADIANFTVEAARAFHDRWYSRDNSVFVVYGPVSPTDVKTLAVKYIDALPEKPVPGRAWLDALRTFEPMDATRRSADASIVRPAIQFEKIVRFPEPFPDRSDAASDILFDFLNSEIAGSLSDVFVENKRLATSIGISRTPFGRGVMWSTVRADLDDGVAPEAMKAELTTYFRALADRGLDSAVVERLKRRRARDIKEMSGDPRRTLSDLTAWFSADGAYADWRKRAEDFASVTPATLEPLLRAMGGEGRQVFGVMEPLQNARRVVESSR